MTVSTPRAADARVPVDDGVALVGEGALPETPKPLKEKNFYFLGYVIDCSCWSLRWQETPIALSRKSFDLLVYLVDHRERVLGKDELMKALWPKQFVEESNLSQHVFLLRKALSKHSSGAKVIETVTGRGYRFVAPIDVPVSQPPSGHVADVPVTGSLAPQAPNLSQLHFATGLGTKRAGMRRSAGIPLAAAIFALGVSAGHYWQTAGVPRAQEAGVAQFDNMKTAMGRGRAESPAVASEFSRCYIAQRTVATGGMLTMGMEQDR